LRTVAALVWATALLVAPTTLHTSPALASTPSQFVFSNPIALADDGQHLWVANNIGGSVVEIAVSSGKIVRILQGPSYGFNSIRRLVLGAGALWVLNSGNDTITEVNVSTGAVIRIIQGSPETLNGVTDFVLYGGHLWVANSAELSAYPPSVSAVNVATGAVDFVGSSPSYQLDQPGALVVEHGHLWVANPANGLMSEIDLKTKLVIRVVAAESNHSYGGAPTALLAEGRHVWVANSDGEVTEFDATNGRRLREIRGSAYGLSNPVALAKDGKYLWVANNDGYSLTKIRLSDGALIALIKGAPNSSRYASYGIQPRAFALDSRYLWIASDFNAIAELNRSSGQIAAFIPH